MAAMAKQVMQDHKKLQTQVNMLNMRVSALLKEEGSQSQGEVSPSLVPTSMKRYGR